jgi:lipopolysaccharide export system protein LptA
VSPQLGKAAAPERAKASPLGAAQAASPTAAATSYPQERPLDQKRPVRIKSDHLRYNDRLKETEFIGHVVATQDTETLLADHMRSRDQGDSAWAQGHLRLFDPERRIEMLADEGDYSGALSEANLRGGVILHSVDPYAVSVTVTGQSAWFQSLSRNARLTGGVRVERGRLTATAQSAEMDGAKDTLELQGGVKVIFGANSVLANNATLDGAAKSVLFVGAVDASLIPAQLREGASHPERP